METIVRKLAVLADKQPDNVALTYLSNSPAEGKPNHRTDVTYAELNSAARQFSHQLLQIVKPGDVAVIVLPHGLDFVVTFLGCLYAGVIPAPSSFPRRDRRRDANHKSARFVSICRHARPAILLTGPNSKEHLSSFLDDDEHFEMLEVSDLLNDIQTDFDSPIELPTIHPEDTAFLQYTSGSTGNPKGVIVTHANLSANEEAIAKAFQIEGKTVAVSWLPMFHDMGLVFGLLHPLYMGGHGVLFAPGQFVSDPLFWLQTISEYRANASGCPNFGYELCINRIRPEDLRGLELSSLRVAFNGAEQVLASTLRKFADKFSDCGFAPPSFLPCYGMAEATLIISGKRPRDRYPLILRAKRAQLEKGRVEITDHDKDDYLEIVSCGKPSPETEVLTVDPETSEIMPAYAVGEIWLNGPGVASRYLNDDVATEETFRAVPNGRTGHYLRTGDLGFLDEDGEVFVTGRLKDLIIVGGRNIYPHDVEVMVREHMGLAGKFHIAATGSQWYGSQRIALLLECDSELRRLAKSEDKSAIERIAEGIRDIVVESFDAMVGTVGFLRTGSLPVTSSGKVRRAECAQILLERNYPSLIYVSEGMRFPPRAAHETGEFDELKQALAAILTSAQMARIEERGRRISLDDLGVDSLGKTAVIAELERRLGIRFDTAELPPSGNLDVLTRLVQAQRGGSAAPARPHLPSPAKPVGTPDSTRPSRPVSVDSKVTSLTDFAQRESRDLFQKTTEFRQWYDDADRRGFKRYLLPVIEQRGGRALVGADRYSPEGEVILFGSADYLGLAHNERVKQAAANAILQHGCNVASVPLVAGSTPIHQILEQQLADLLSFEACVLFPTGHSANMATIAALCSQYDTVVVDNRVHYSILEGVRLAHCSWRTFLHNSPEDLRAVLQKVRDENPSRGVLVVAEGVYGIDGDLANIKDLRNVAREFDARLMLDDAHGIGVLGSAGEGTAAHLQSGNADIVMGSLSKSLGSFGGFILASRDVVDYLRFYAKAISFAVGLPVVNASAALEAMQIIREEPERLASLRAKSDFFRQALTDQGFAEVQASQSTIMSLEIGDEEVLRDVSKELFEAGVWAEGLPFPAVSRGQERLRFRVRECHTYEDLEEAAVKTGEVLRRLLPKKEASVAAPEFESSYNGSTWLVTSAITDKQAAEICELATIQARRCDAALPWISPEFITKYFRRESYWKALQSRNVWHLAYQFGELVAAFSVEITQSKQQGQPKHMAMIGSCFCEAEAEATMMTQIREVLQSCQGTVDVVTAPASYPVAVFGAGLQTWQSSNGKPFLESSLPTQLGLELRSMGFRVAGSKRYCRVQLTPDEQRTADPRITVRDFSRAEYREDMARFVTPIFNQTIAALDLCTPIPDETMQGLIQDLRELVLPGFWLVAEYDGQPAGFAICYPNITSEFKRIGGRADVADFQRIADAMEKSKEAFLAWMAVDPKFANRGVSDAITAEMKARLLQRGCEHMWLSWEFVDGTMSLEQHIQRVGQPESMVEMPFFAVTTSAEASVPKPHFRVSGSPKTENSSASDQTR